MRKFKLPTDANSPITDVVVLVRISNAFSEDDFSVNVFVDPWYLVNDGFLEFGKDWLFTVALDEGGPDHIEDGKQTPTIFLPWASSATTGVIQSGPTVLHSTGRRELYRYNALKQDHLRLLYLFPGAKGEPLQAILSHIPSNSAGTYRAISYVWGTDQRTKELITPDGVIPITFSLSETLQSLRQENEAIMLWADAVCINQADNKEKSHQIRMLPRIFQGSVSTYAFLDGGEEAEAALEMLMQVRSKAVLEERERTGEDIDSDDWPSDLPVIPRSWEGGRIPPLDHSIWVSVRALFALPYFRRIWVIQEVVAAPGVKVVCGKLLIDWNDLHLALETVDREVQTYDQDFSQMRSDWEPFLSLATLREWEARQYRWNLMMLLEHFRYAESTLCRDRLFALVGLASDGDVDDFEPDYDSSLDQVILKFAHVFVRHGQGMQLLYRAGLNAQSDRFPSWIPDWFTKRPVGIHASADTGVTFSACGPQVASIDYGPGADELSIKGHEMDVVERISFASNVEQEWEKYFEEVDEMIDSSVLTSVMGSPEELKWKVPIASAKFPRAAGSGAMDMMKSYGAFRSYIKGSGKIEAGNHVTGYFKNAWKNYLACLKGTLEEWRFVVTRRGYVGIVPNLAQVGDVVTIMKGGCVPFLLRESSTRSGALRLVGECYIHGIMKGESIWLPGVVEKTFRLH
jgi:Heterokaryon incompatibility protein (HET)